MRKIIIILSLLLLLAGCAAEDSAETEAPTEITSATVTDFSKYEQFLNPNTADRNWAHASMGCIFSSPEEIALDFLFYLGTDNGGWTDISETSCQFLIDQGFMTEMDLQVMPAEELNRIMQATFGISLSDATIPESWRYISTEDAYCANNNDAYFPSHFEISGITAYSNGLIEITYTPESIYDAKTQHFYDHPTMMMTLQKTASGDLLVVSNTIE